MSEFYMFDEKKKEILVDKMKCAICEYLLNVNMQAKGGFIPPTAIDWLGNGIVRAILPCLTSVTK